MVLFCAPCAVFAQMVPAAPNPATVQHSDDGEFSAFDLVVGGNNYGVVYGRFGDEWFEPSEVRNIIPLLPAVGDPENFIPLFQGRIEKIRTIRDVGVLRVDTANFTLSLEVDQAETILATVGSLKELQGTEKNLSVLNNLFIAGGAETNQIKNIFEGISLTHDTMLSKENMALQGSGTMTRQNGYALRSALAKKDFNAFGVDLTASGGMLETGTVRFARGLGFMGMRLASNQNLLFHDPQLQGSNIELFLPRRAQVEIFRGSAAEGQVLFSRILNFGTLQIDTRAFPQGSYDIEIIVRDGGEVLSRETRPFIKTQALPPREKPVLDIGAGMFRQDLDVEGSPIVQASYRARLSESIGGSIGVVAASGQHLYEVSFMREKTGKLFRTMGLIQVSLTGAFSAFFRPAGVEASLSWKSAGAAATLLATKTYAQDAAFANAGSIFLSERESAYFSLSKPLDIFGRQVSTGFSAEISSTPPGGRAYHYGPSLAYNLEPVWGYTPELRFEYSISDIDNRILARVNMRNMEDSVWVKTMNVEGTRNGVEDRLSSSFGVSYNGRNAVESEGWRKRLNGNFALRGEPLWADREKSQGSVSADAEYTGDVARWRAYLDQAFTPEAAGRIAGEGSSTVVWQPGARIRAASQTVPSDMAVAMIALRGAAGVRMDITVNGITRAEAGVGDTVLLPIPSYERVRIDVVDRGNNSMLQTREKAQTVIGYPGNVAYREFNIVGSRIILGTLVDEEKNPVSNARFTVGGSAYYTDEGGFFSFEEAIEDGRALEISGINFTCLSPPLSSDDKNSFIDLGTLACKKKTGHP